MKVISVVNVKGGAGKTTIATNVGTALAAEGKKVMLVDTVNKQESALAFSQIRNANDDLAQISTIYMPAPLLLKNIQNYDNFDYIIIDAGAGDNELMRAAVLLSKYGMLLMPVRYGAYDLWATEVTLEVLRDLRSMLPGYEKNYLLLNKVVTNKKMKIINAAAPTLQEYCDKYDVKILKSQLGDRIAFNESSYYGMNVIEYAKEEKNSIKAAAELRALVEEIKDILSEGDY